MKQEPKSHIWHARAAAVAALLCASIFASATPSHDEVPVVTPLATLTGAGTDAGDEFGVAVGIDSDTVVVGAHLQDAAEGAAHVFTGARVRWAQQGAALKASDAAADDEFGISAAVDGNTLIVGAVGDESRRGAAYVFTRSGTTWTQQAKLTASDGASGDEFGASVAIFRDAVAVGSPLRDSGRGSVYVFTRSGTVWTQQPRLDAGDMAIDDLLGASVTLDDDTIVAGAPGETAGQGAAYVFTLSGGVWSQQKKLVAADGAAIDGFGVSVAVDGETAAVGASHDDDDGSDSGAAYVFTRSGTTWTQEAKQTASDAVAGDDFGTSVSLEGDRLVVGAPGDDSAQGAAYLFVRSGSTWTERVRYQAVRGRANSALVGHSVALSGETVVAGALGSSLQPGAAYVFATNAPPTSHAGDDAVILSASQLTTMLTGTGADPDGDQLTCQWLDESFREIARSAAPSTGTCTLTLDLATRPTLDPGPHTFRFAVTDVSATIPTTTYDEVVVRIDVPAVVSAGPDIEILRRDEDATTLNGTATDADGDGLICQWVLGTTVVAGPKISLDGTCNLALPLATLPESITLGDGDTEFTFEVEDRTATMKDTVKVTISDPPRAVNGFLRLRMVRVVQPRRKPTQTKIRGTRVRLVVRGDLDFGADPASVDLTKRSALEFGSRRIELPRGLTRKGRRFWRFEGGSFENGEIDLRIFTPRRGGSKGHIMLIVENWRDASFSAGTNTSDFKLAFERGTFVGAASAKLHVVKTIGRSGLTETATFEEKSDLEYRDELHPTSTPLLALRRFVGSSDSGRTVSDFRLTAEFAPGSKPGTPPDVTLRAGVAGSPVKFKIDVSKNAYEISTTDRGYRYTLIDSAASGLHDLDVDYTTGTVRARVRDTSIGDPGTSRWATLYVSVGIGTVEDGVQVRARVKNDSGKRLLYK